MRLFIKNKIFTLSGSSFVLDEKGNKVFKVKGKWGLFSPTHKKKIIDKDGNLRYIVRNKFWRFISTSCFLYDDSKQKIAMLTNNDFDIRSRYVLKGYQDEIVIKGNFSEFPKFTMDIEKNGKNIGKITRDFTIIRDSFVLDIFDDTEDAFLVALVIAIDNIADDRRSRNNRN